MAQIASVDGCPGGWLCVVLDTDKNEFRVEIFCTAADLLAHDHTIQVMTIDMPIGLVNAGRRRCDELACDILGERRVCVSNAPIRPALYAPSRLAASAITQATTGREVGSTEWALYPKIINLDVSITPAHQRWCFEIHPEVCFWAWNNSTPLQEKKDSPAGMQAREALIEAAWPGARQAMLTRLQQGYGADHFDPDDLNDAFAALWTARRIASAQARRIPERPDVDAKGLRMEMWY
jgi:predicted RNase H-like nuclease